MKRELKLFGFITDYKSIAKKLQSENLELRKLTFRPGDWVFINDGKRDPQKSHYLLRENGDGSGMWYVSDQQDGEICGYPVSVHALSNKAPTACKCCGQLLQP